MKFSSTNAKNPENKENAELNRMDNKNQNNKSRDRTLEVYVGNLPFKATYQDIKDFFSSKCGTPFVMPQFGDKFGRKKTFVFLKFNNEKEVNEAIALNDTEFMGRKLKIRKGHDPENLEKAKQEIINKQNEIKSHVVYVWNLPKETNEQEIWDTFETVGAVNHVVIYNDKSETKYDAAHVQFSNHEDALKAHFLKKFELNGQKLRVEISFSKKSLDS